MQVAGHAALHGEALLVGDVRGLAVQGVVGSEAGACRDRTCATGPEDMTVPLCGDPTCENHACSQEAIDVWHKCQHDEAGQVVAAALGVFYDRSTGRFLPR